MPRLAKCKVCKTPYPRNLDLRVVWCSADCAFTLANQRQEKAREKREQQERKETREKLKKFRKLSWYHERTKRACHAYIRARDEGRECITCDTVLLKLGRVGGDYDAGHFRSVGAAGHLRYVETNIHGQCKHCNDYGAGKQQVYQSRLPERIGQEALDRLLNDNEPVKWTRELLNEIYEYYTAKLKELRARHD